MYDLLIQNGKIVDGTGKSAFAGNVAIQDGQIAGIGKVDGRARRKINASGQLVAPGWVDVHTHFDGQASWDPLLTPASNQGTTTVIMGNCGVGFAPCKPDEHEMLISVMEDVEDIPGAALTEGITWEWESFPEYLDAMERLPRAIDIGSQVPHCAVRCYVMGARGARNEKATEDDIRQMADIVRQGIDAGAVGFTTSRTKLHITRQGEVMPGTYADEDELLGIGSTLGEIGKGVYGLVSDFDDWEKEMDWMKRLSIKTRRPINFVLFFRKEEEFSRAQKQLQYVKDAEKEGALLIPHVGARPVNILMGFDCTVHPFMLHQSYAPLAALPWKERLAKLRDPAVRAAILAEKVAVPHTGTENTQEILEAVVRDFDRFYVLGSPPDYEPTPEQSIASIAKREGREPKAVAYDTLLKDDGKELLYFPNFGYDSGDFSRQLALMKDSSTVISLADSGAHCGVLCDATVPSHLLSYFVRDRDRGERLPLEWAVRSHTRDTARCVGLYDRGTLEPGMKADLNIIDFENLQLQKPEVIYDLPAGGRRVSQTVRGYTATVVSGEVIYEKGEHTGALPGKLVRGGQSAPTA